MPIATIAEDEVDELGVLGWEVAVTAGDGGAPLEAHPWAAATIVLLGNEAAGLTPEIMHAADAAITIDHEPSVESLNVAIAGALVMFDWRRRA